MDIRPYYTDLIGQHKSKFFQLFFFVYKNQTQNRTWSVILMTLAILRNYDQTKSTIEFQ